MSSLIVESLNSVSGDMNFNQMKIEGQVHKVQTISPVAGVLTIDCSLGGVVLVNLTANVTSIVTLNLVAGCSLLLVLKQDATGGRTVLWPANYLHPQTANTANSPGANAYDLVDLISFEPNIFNFNFRGRLYS